MIKTICLLTVGPLVGSVVFAQTISESNGDLLLRDFKPKTRVVVKETHILHAKYR